MKQFLQITTLALIGGGLLAGSPAIAQPSSTSQSSQNQYTGVSHPPPNSTIVANEPATPPPTQSKPSAAVTAQSSPAPQDQATPQRPAPARQPVAAAQPAPSKTTYANASATTAPASASNSSRWNNTDFGIVTKLPSPKAEQQVEANDARLENRPSSNPSFGVLSVIPFAPHALNAGTNITVRLLQPLSTNSTPQGTPFRASVVSNVYRGSKLIIPAGSVLRGVVTDVHPGRHLISRATLRLTPQRVLLPDGTSYRLDAEAIYTSAHHTNTTGEGAFQPSMHVAKDAAEYGAGTGLGALVGAKFGPGGALVGSLVGAGAVSAHMLVQPPSSLTLPRNAEIIFSLTQPMELTPVRE